MAQNKLAYTELTDELLTNSFNLLSSNRARYTYIATFVPKNYSGSVADWDNRTFTANSKTEAVQIAREYGLRFLNKKVRFVYRQSMAGSLRHQGAY